MGAPSFHTIIKLCGAFGKPQISLPNNRNAQTGASQRMPRSFFAFFQFSQRICCVSTSGYAVSCALSRSAEWSFTPVIWRLS